MQAVFHLGNVPEKQKLLDNQVPFTLENIKSSNNSTQEHGLVNETQIDKSKCMPNLEKSVADIDNPSPNTGGNNKLSLYC